MVLTSPTTIDSAVQTDVRVGPVPASLTDETTSGVLWHAAPGRFLLDIPGVARYLVEDGTTITVDPAPDAAQAEVERHLRGTPEAVVHLQRGTPVLHAAVVAHPGPGPGAIVLAGDSGAGKSMLAATLWTRGYRVLADDLAPIVIDPQGHERPVVLATCGALVLWPDAIGHLGELDPDHVAGTKERVTVHGPSGQRRRIDVSDQFAPGPLPVEAIWWLSVHNGDTEVHELGGAARFSALGSIIAHSRIAGALLDRQAYLGIAASLATSAVPVRRVKRRRGHWTAAALADLVESGDAT